MNDATNAGQEARLERLVGPALTYASHIADCAERYAAASDRFEIADEKVALADTQADEEEAQDEREEAAIDMREHRHAMQNAIYEYRKRLPELHAALQPNAQVKPRLAEGESVGLNR